MSDNNDEVSSSGLPLEDPTYTDPPQNRGYRMQSPILTRIDYLNTLYADNPLPTFETPSTSNGERGNIWQDRWTATKRSTIDLRALDCTSTYDAHLMCPICHVPFIDPIVLDCDHTFCSSCFDELRYGVTTSNRSKCPSCRTTITSEPRKASRLIQNMCNDIKVQCPNKGCKRSMARGYIETHVLKTCPAQQLACPVSSCEKTIRRKDYEPGVCGHGLAEECGCGALVEPGQEFEKHENEECPNRRTACVDCGEMISSNGPQAGKHVCRPKTDQMTCPGMKYGCTDEVPPDDMDLHISTCSLARMAPYLESQSCLLRSVQEQLNYSKTHNASLEAELDRMNHYIHDDLHTKLESLATASRESDTLHEDHFHDHDNDVEEIHRDDIPSAAAIHHRDLLLPAHVRDLTPSPDVLAIARDHAGNHAGGDEHTQMYNHLLSLHENLRHTVSNMETEINGLRAALAEVDARLSTQIINETLRINEDLAFTNASLVGHRNQVQYLLNRERIGREQAILRGRVGGQSQQIQGQSANDTDRQTPSTATPSTSTQPQQTPSDGFPFPIPGASMTRTVSGTGGGSGPSSASTSPVFTGIGLNGSRRPSMRGGSQERVKL